MIIYLISFKSLFLYVLFFYVINKMYICVLLKCLSYKKMGYQIASILISVAVFSLASVRMVYFKILKLAKDKGLVDNPDARKLQKKPVPVVGGLAVFLGVVVGVLSGCVLLSLTELDSGYAFDSHIAVNVCYAIFRNS